MALKHTNPRQPRFDKKNRTEQTAFAPYNFVPLPERMVEARPPLSHDTYHPDGLTGWIDCDLETCSPTYIRGMLTEVQFAEFGQAGPDQLKEAQKIAAAPFFSTHESEIERYPVPCLPGSSLRGMIRQLVEIAGHGRMRWVGATPTFTFRAVAAQGDDPLRDPYQSIIGQFARNVRAGFLEKRGDNWFIRPALTPRSQNWPETGAYLKVKEESIVGRAIPGLLRLTSRDYKPGYYLVSFDAEVRRSGRGDFTAITRIGERQADYRYKGVLVCSGNMMETGERTRRKNHSLILLPDERAKSLPIETQAVKDYLDGLTPYQQELTAWGGKQGCLADGAPVFFVPEGNIVRYFGHSPNFRIPARLNVAGETRAANPLDFVPANLRQNDKPDLADAIFGWVEESEKGKVIGPPGQRAGRVFFGDARFVAAAEGVWLQEKPIAPRTLSGPKPTTFQHYLAQDAQAGRNGHDPDDKKSLAHYGTPPDETQIRGYKMYWHKGKQPDIEASAKEREHEKQLTRIMPVKPGVRFSFKVYFENLRSEELGALLWALQLPGEPGKLYRHKLGMGKPLGMGAVAITPRLTLTNRPERYGSLFGGDGSWNAAATSTEMEAHVKAFEMYLLQENGIAQVDRLYKVERIRMLLTMLEWREGTPDWLAKTRYMEIEHETGRPRPNDTVNEYKERPVLPDPLGVEGKEGERGRETRPTQPSTTPERTPPHPTPVTQAVTPKTPPRTTPEIGERVAGKVDTIEDNGDVYLIPEKREYKRWLLRVRRDQQESISYRAGESRACLVVALLSDDDLVECKPAPKRGSTTTQLSQDLPSSTDPLQEPTHETEHSQNPGGDLQDYEHGIVTKYFPDKGQGIIQSDNANQSILVHRSRFSLGLTALFVGDRVAYKVLKGAKSLEAHDIRLEQGEDKP